MTIRKHFKQLVRERMTKTGESYSSARRQLLKQTPPFSTDPAWHWHFPGSIPAATALRVLLAAAGINDPHTGKPFSEAMLFGIAGGVGIGVATFRYEKSDVSSFFVAGRHLWFDDQAYLHAALDRVGIAPVERESSGAKPAEKHLRELLADGPCVACVDMAHLPHRALPADFSGSGYHVIVVYKIDDANQSAVIGDLTDEPITIPLRDLATARARIKKQANRLLGISKKTAFPDLKSLVHGGLGACHKAMTAKPGKGPLAMSTMDSLHKLGIRLAGDSSKEGWEKMYRPGANLWRALTSMHSFIETYGTGGGLCRPMMADFLNEAGEAIPDPRLTALARQYADLGRAWSDLAGAALPDSVPLLKRARELRIHQAELMATGGPVEQKQMNWAQLEEFAAVASHKFPLTESECADLRAGLQQRVKAITAAEEAALAAMANALA
jgi:Domain of unknown function (DUF4872)/Butirosin biosynthesis protein H, N-terminal